MPHAALEFLARRGRMVWSLALFVAALILLLVVNGQRHFHSPPDELGPRFWPRLCLAVMLALTALDAALAFRAARRPSGAADQAVVTRAPEGISLLFAGMALVIAYAVATVLLGFPLATVFFLAAFSYLGGYRHLPSLLAIAFGMILVLLYIFVYLVYISLPLGVGPFLNMNVALYRLLGIF